MSRWGLFWVLLLLVSILFSCRQRFQAGWSARRVQVAMALKRSGSAKSFDFWRVVLFVVLLSSIASSFFILGIYAGRRDPINVSTPMGVPAFAGFLANTSRRAVVKPPEQLIGKAQELMEEAKAANPGLPPKKNILRKPMAPMRYDYTWDAGSSSFARKVSAENGDFRAHWVELHQGREAFRFEETTLESKGKSPTVVLRDSERRMSIKIEGAHSFIQMDGDPSRRWAKLYDGVWTKVNGKDIVNRAPYSNGRPPPPQHTQAQNPSVKIMVLMAAYRDPLCGNTLYEGFLHAKYPDRIFFGVIEQFNPVDTWQACLETYCTLVSESGRRGETCRRNQVKITRVPPETARGVMPARYRQQLLIEDQEFCLQIDAHSAFEDDWDIVALNDWLATENEMAVMTTYPNRVTQRHVQGSSPTRCSTMWSGGLVVDGVAASVLPNPSKTPFLIPFFGAGVAFSKCHAIFNVPYDPYMPYLFKGEEFNRAIRLFTHGYDVYSPKMNYVFHFYDDDPKPPYAQKYGHRKRDFFSGGWHTSFLTEQTNLRWRAVLGLRIDNKLVMDDDLDIFGLGTRRSLADYEKFAKLDFKKETATSSCGNVGSLEWVPYTYEDLPDKRFRPSGPSCPARSEHKCCSNLAKSRLKAEAMLNTSTEQLYQDYQARSRNQPAASGHRGPFFSMGDASAIPCSSRDLAV